MYSFGLQFQALSLKETLILYGNENAASNATILKSTTTALVDGL